MHMVAEEGMHQPSINLLLKYLIKTALMPTILGKPLYIYNTCIHILYTYIIHVYIYYTCTHPFCIMWLLRHTLPSCTTYCLSRTLHYYAYVHYTFLRHSLTHSFPPSLSPSLPPSPPPSLTHSFPLFLLPSLTQSLTLFTHSLTHSLTRSLTHSLPHSLTPSLPSSFPPFLPPSLQERVGLVRCMK